MRVLAVTHELPTTASPRTKTWASVARQIESIRASGLEVEVLEVKGKPKLKYAPALAAVVRRAGEFDLVHAHYGYCGWLARMQLTKPVVISFMGSDLLGTADSSGRATVASRAVVMIDRWLARTVAAVIVKSAAMAATIAPVRAHVIPNGVDLELFRPASKRDARAELAWDETRNYVLFPGAPENPRKAFPLAQAAVEHASAEIGSRVELVPLWDVAPERVPLLMNACDALVMTSHWEGSPNAIKEAMASDLPVISVPVGDVPQLLRDVTNCAVCPRDPFALGSALSQILRRGEATNGRSMIRQRGLSLENVAQRVIRIYEDVLQRPSARARSR